MNRIAYCNEGCNNQFIAQTKVDMLPKAIEKVYFECTHCDYEYVMFYTDVETRKLQEQMQELHKCFADPAEHKGKLIKQERELKNQIKRGMARTRKRVEGVGGT